MARFKKGDHAFYGKTLQVCRVLSTNFDEETTRYWIAAGRGRNYREILVLDTDLEKPVRTRAKLQKKISQKRAAGTTGRVGPFCLVSGECSLHEHGNDIWLVNGVWQPVPVRPF